MANHRWLVITVVVAVVVAVVGIGTMASATNDTDESVRDELSQPFLPGNDVPNIGDPGNMDPDA